MSSPWWRRWRGIEVQLVLVYKCVECGEHYETTDQSPVIRRCPACAWLGAMSYARQDHYLAWLEAKAGL